MQNAKKNPETATATAEKVAKKAEKKAAPKPPEIIEKDGKRIYADSGLPVGANYGKSYSDDNSERVDLPKGYAKGDFIAYLSKGKKRIGALKGYGLQYGSNKSPYAVLIRCDKDSSNPSEPRYGKFTQLSDVPENEILAAIPKKEKFAPNRNGFATYADFLQGLQSYLQTAKLETAAKGVSSLLGKVSK